MAEFYKDKNFPVTFNLKDKEAKENYAVWDNETKKFLRGEEWDKTKYMKKDEFNKAHPHKQKNTTYIRDVVINGKEYAYSFKKTANDEINKTISTLEAAGVDPLSKQFVLNKEGAGLTSKYTVTISGNAQPQQQAQPQTKLKMDIGIIDNRNEQEKELCQAFNGVPIEMRTYDNFKKVIVDNEITLPSDRVAYLFDRYVKR